MVKWLKIDKQEKTRRRRQEIGQVAIYYISKQAILLVTSEMQVIVALHSLAVLARLKQETIPKYVALQSTKDLTFHASTAHRNSYGVHISAVSSSQYQRNYVTRNCNHER